MDINIAYFENSKKYDNCKRVGVRVYREDINMYFHIDRHIPIVEGKSDEYYTDNVMDFKGRNGKTMRDEIEEFKTYVPIVEETEVVEEVKEEVSPMIGKEISL